MPAKTNTDILRDCIDERRFCGIQSMYEMRIRHLLPLAMSEGFYLSLIEDNMNFDGYLLDRCENIDKIIPASDEALKIARKSGMLDNIEVPDAELSGEAGFFAWLVAEKLPVYIECSVSGSRSASFFLGRVEDCGPSSFALRTFSLDYVWNPETLKIPYSQVLRVSFGTKALASCGAFLSKGPVVTI